MVRPIAFRATFRIDGRIAVGQEDFDAYVSERNNWITVRRETLARFSPDSESIMEFQDKRAYEIVEKIYSQHLLLSETIPNTWDVQFSRELHMTDDRHLFNTRREGYPLYEGKMFHQFDAFFAPPQFWIEPRKGVEAYKGRRGGTNDYQHPRLAIRAVASNTNERTLITAILPSNVFSAHSLYTKLGQSLAPSDRLFVLARMNSYILDYTLRYKMASNVSLFHVYSLPVPRLTAGNSDFDALVPMAARLTCTRPEFADLWGQVMGRAWTADDGATDTGERQRLRDAIDGGMARLYGLTRDEYAHILGTFPLVLPESDARRERRAAVLAAYDAVGSGG